MSETEAAEPARPHLRIVKGDPTPEELAALVAVLAGRGGGDDAPAAPTPVGTWADRSRGLRRPLLRGVGAWRASGLPGS